MAALDKITNPETPMVRFEASDISDIPKVTAFVEEELEKIDCPMKTVIQMSIAIDEIYSNIVKYGYADNKGPVTVRLLFDSDESTVYLRFEDEAIPYDPLNKEDPDITLSAEERDIGGLGIFMVKKTMDDLYYEYTDGKNILTVVKKI